jgi:hypothetical protein
MHSAKRVIAVAALGLPVLFGAAGVANASSMDSDSKPPAHKHHHHKTPNVDQDQSNTTDQSNKNDQKINQFNVGDHGHQNALAFNNQSNTNSTDQDQSVDDGKKDKDSDD